MTDRFWQQEKSVLLYYFTQFCGAVTRDRKIRTLDFENGPGHA
jgi:hypothetical protein